MEQVFNGIVFVADERGYYRAKNNFGLYLHRCVWEYYNTKIPDGYEIHHKDFNPSNNDISNLQLLSVKEHKKLHADLLTTEQREWKRNNLIQTAQPKAAVWHRSENGKQLHRKLIQQQRELGVFKHRLVCTNCGKDFIGEKKRTNTFCCNACKSAYRRTTQVDTVSRTCVVCGKPFLTNKYKPTQTCSRSCANKLWHKTK